MKILTLCLGPGKGLNLKTADLNYRKIYGDSLIGRALKNRLLKKFTFYLHSGIMHTVSISKNILGIATEKFYLCNTVRNRAYFFEFLSRKSDFEYRNKAPIKGALNLTKLLIPSSGQNSYRL